MKVPPLPIAIALSALVVLAATVAFLELKDLSKLGDVGEFIGAVSSSLALIWLIYDQVLIQGQLTVYRQQLEVSLSQSDREIAESERVARDKRVARVSESLPLFEQMLLRHAYSIYCSLVSTEDDASTETSRERMHLALYRTCESDLLREALENSDLIPSYVEVAATAALYHRTYSRMQKEFATFPETDELFTLWSENSDFKRLENQIRGSANP